MSRWRDVPKIDTHIHIVLHQREGTDLRLNPPDAMLEAMDRHNVERAVVLPINYPDYFPLEPEQRVDWLRSNNEHQAAIARDSNGRLLAFADCRIDGPYAASDSVHAEVVRAVETLGLCGLKIHPSNLKASATDARLRPWLDAARDLGVPVLVHSNPSAEDPNFDESAPRTIYRAMFAREQAFGICHLGGIAFLETVVGPGYVDVSYGLLLLSELYGIPFCERLLRRIGMDRILFGTDFPILGYEAYEAVFDAMNLTTEELEKMAFRNAERMLSGQPPLGSE
jgi:predicted TIM-barrel fold metal-dependent hydrolase